MRNGAIIRLFKYIKKYKLQMFVALIFALISNILMVIGPFLVGKAIDAIVSKGKVNFQQLFKIIMILAVVYGVSALFSWLFTVIANKVAYGTVQDIRKEAFNKISSLPLKYFDSNAHGDIISRLTNDIDAISDGLLQGITQFFPGIVVILGSIGVMIKLNLTITFVIILMTPPCFFIAAFITKRSNKMFRQQQKTLGELNGYIEEIIGGQKVVKAFGYEAQSQRVFNEINERLYKCGRYAQFYSSLTNPSTRFVNNISYILVGVVGGISAVAGNLTIGMISSFLTYSTQFSQPINNMTSIAAQFQAALASAERVFEVLNEASEKEEEKNTMDIKHCKGEISFENVSFSYSKNTELIKNLSLAVKPGNTIAIVGPTGAGKTTLVNLLMRFYDLHSGGIFVDGTNIGDVTRDSLRNSFGMVLQDTWIFAGTIKENIAFGRPEATMEQVEAAARAAHIHSYIKRLPNGYDTFITEAGENLSQGQRQLLTIARVMLINPPMLILDEATSSIDTRTEIQIQKAFLSMLKGRTSFIIAHRLSTIRDADLILVMNNGEIVEQGTHNELLNRAGFYAKLYSSQFEK
jgi:glucan exporter ATP-binding protein